MELAVIATPVSGTLDIIEDRKDGFLVPPDSPENLARAMESIIQDADHCRRLGQFAREKVIHQFSLDSVATAYSKLYDNLRRPLLRPWRWIMKDTQPRR